MQKWGLFSGALPHVQNFPRPYVAEKLIRLFISDKDETVG